MLQGWLQIAVFCAVLVALVPVVGGYMARVYAGETVALSRVVGPVERLIYRLLRVDVAENQGWKAYAGSLILFSALGWLLLYGILRTQTIQPWNPQGFHSGTWDLSFSTASSFVTNTNWQYYGGETTLSYFAQMAGLAVQNFVSAAAGIVVAVALIRGIVSRRTGAGLGNFWQDLTRTILYVLLPLSIVGALVLVSQGVMQTLGHYVDFTSVNGTTSQLARGPVASQEVIKELGTNGGGFYNANSAHPFENPTPLTNILQIWALLVIPFGLVSMFGRMCRDRRQGRLLIAVMAGLLVTFGAIATFAEQTGNPRLAVTGVDQSMSVTQSGGNMEGKEIRFGTAGCGAFSAATTGTSTGAVNCAHDSLTPLGGAVPMAKAVRGLFSVNEATGESNWQFAIKNSLELQRRDRNWAETLYGSATGILAPGDKYGPWRQKIMEWSSKPVALSDMISAVPTWLAKYQHEIDNGASHGDAVYEADRAVRRAHGSTAATTRTAMMRNANPWLVSIYNFFSDVMNRQMETIWKAGETKDLVKAGEWGAAAKTVPALTASLFAYAIWPAIVESWVSPHPHKEDDSWVKKSATAMTFALGSSWVGVRDFASALTMDRDPQFGLTGTAYQTMSNAFRDLRKDDPFSQERAGRLLQDAGIMVGTITGMLPAQISKSGRFLYDVQTGNETPEGPWQWLTGLRFGTTKKHSASFDEYLKGSH